MTDILSPPLPDGALLARYQTAEDYTDCFVMDVPGEVSLADYIRHFYGSLSFWPERMVLGLIGKGATVGDIDNLADHDATDFAAWSVEARTDDQILLRDFRGSTRSWLHVSSIEGGTRLWFGSAVIATSRNGEDKALPKAAVALMDGHVFYAKQLIRGAVRSLRKA